MVMHGLLTVMVWVWFVVQHELVYSLGGTSQSIAGLEYFFINPSTGYVRVIKSLALDLSNTRVYRVGMMTGAVDKSLSLSLFLHPLLLWG